MNAFRYQRVEQSADAISAVAGEPDGAFIAGGTTLVDLMKEGVQSPKLLVGINPLPLSEIKSDGSSVRIGALVKNSDLAEHPLIQSRYPMLSEALLSGASQQLRNAATVGGNLMQRTRCYYFRDPAMPCNKREPGTGCGALDGFNRIHAVLGGSEHCVATHASDMCVALAALDAVIHVQGPKDERAIPIRDFYLLPGQTPEKETVLDRGELITGVELPDVPFASKSRYIKVRDRASYEFAIASAAAALDIRDQKIIAARLALGGVGTIPWRANEAEKILTGAKADEALFRKAADAELREAKGLRYNSFKIELARRTIVRALLEAGRMA
jgi:xanthine dehydrogenase YagS FAD-binding subunit